MVLEPLELRIRRASSADIPTLAAMNKRLIEDEGHPNPMTVAQLADRMASFLAADYTGYLALRGDEPVGYALCRDDGDAFYLRHLYVERGHRRQGIARTFLDWLFANVWPNKPVRLDVLAHNEDAIAFYTAYGFRVMVLGLEKGTMPRDT
ncbi:MAG: GNAT family N-acetyltransferase [Anaerolineae bacterium]|jgi:ribosomal protein S18 acetylase RimI-like enzyme|nr:GNAT family N-acetyltransferase [Anaerolineae bacterium]